MYTAQATSTTIYGQLLLFPETTEERNTREIRELKLHCEKLRKSLYARNGQLAKAYSEIKHELDQLKASICRYEKTQPEMRLF